MSKAVDAMDKLIADDLYRRRHLSFPEQCAVYAALRRGFRQAKIARALQASSAVVSLINNCERENSRRYPRVAQEYRRLGHDAFCDHYLTDAVFERFALFAGKPDPSEEARPKARGADFAASKYAWRPFQLRRIDDSVVTLAIVWRNTGQDVDLAGMGDTFLPAGWAWRQLTEEEIKHYYIRPQMHHPSNPYGYSPAREDTSAKALDRAFEDHGLDPPLMEFKQAMINLHREMDR